MSSPQPPDGGQQGQPPQDSGAQQGGDSTQVVNPAQAAQAAQQAQGQSGGDSVVSPMQQQPGQNPGGGDSTSVVPPSMQPPQPMYQQPGTQSQPGGFPAQPPQQPGTPGGGFPAQQQGFQQQGFGAQPQPGQPQPGQPQPGGFPGQQTPVGQPPGPYGMGQQSSGSGNMLQIAMWGTIGVAGLMLLGNVINTIYLMSTFGGAAAIAAIGGLVMGLIFGSACGVSAWFGGQGKEWGRIVVTVFGGFAVLGGIINLFVTPIVGIIVLLFGAAILVVWWLPDTSAGMKAKAGPSAMYPGMQPGYGQPQMGQPQQYGQPQMGQPQQYGQPQYGQPQYGQPGQPPQQGGFPGQPQMGQPQQYGQPQYGQPGQPPQQGGFPGQQPPQW